MQVQLYRQTISQEQQTSIIIATNTLTLLKQHQTRSSAVAVIADRTAYDVGYSYRLLTGIAVVSMSLYHTYLKLQTEVKSAFAF